MSETLKQTTIKEDWDLIITPRKKWYDLQLGDVWRYRDLIFMFVRRDFVSRYKQTILGPLWFLIQPLTSTSNTFVANAHLFGKVYFPRLVMPLSTVVSNLITFGIQFSFFLVFLLYFWLRGVDVYLTAWAWTLPLLILLMAGLGLGFGIIVSSLTTKYRDLQNLIGFGVSLWMYATPIIYPVSSIPEKWRWVADWNPVTPIVETFRAGFLGAGAASWPRLGYSAVFMLVVLFIGVVIFNRVEKTFIDTV
jgi:lipopolysaccharide transport system permease protein